MPSNLYYIIIINNDMKIDITEINWYDSIYEYRYIIEYKFDEEREAMDFIAKNISLLPIPHPVENTDVYSVRCRNAWKDLNVG